MTPRPILFIHGQSDSHLPADHSSRRLYALAGEPKSLWIAPGARHNQAVLRHVELYERLTTGFFDRHLARLTPAAEPPPLDAPMPEPTEAVLLGSVRPEIAHAAAG